LAGGAWEPGAGCCCYLLRRTGLGGGRARGSGGGRRVVVAEVVEVDSKLVLIKREVHAAGAGAGAGAHRHGQTRQREAEAEARRHGGIEAQRLHTHRRKALSALDLSLGIASCARCGHVFARDQSAVGWQAAGSWTVERARRCNMRLQRSSPLCRIPLAAPAAQPSAATNAVPRPSARAFRPLPVALGYTLRGSASACALSPAVMGAG